MKKKVLLSSIATIALCLCLIAGSTFALFTDSTNFNIAVTSGDVEIEAYATINSVWSAYGEGVTEAGDEFLIDENGHPYAHGKRDPIDGRYIFTNGGEAKLDGNNLVINRITPGDRVDIDINVTNKSDVALVYRYKLVSNNSNLATGMVVTIDEVSYEALAIWTSEWYPVVAAPNGEPNKVPVKTISVELPVYAGNEYQSEAGEPQSVEYTIIVEAVQGNAVTDNEEEFVIYQTEVVAGVEPTLDQSGNFDPSYETILHENMYLLGNTYIASDTNCAGVVVRNVTADVNNEYDSAIVATAAPTVMIYDCDFILGDGEYIMTGTGSYEPMVHVGSNVKVNGEYLTNETVGQYFKDCGYVYVFDVNVETN